MIYSAVMLFKSAEQTPEVKKSLLKTPLLPHQQRVVDKIKEKPGLLVYHGVGKGKSLGSLAALDALGQKATVVTPAALKSNILKERDKHFEEGLNIDVDSLENVARKQTTTTNPALVVDEAHRLRDPASKSLQALKKINKNVDKTILLTGTPMVNSPADIAPLINLVSHQNLLPENKSEFEKKYIYNKTVKPSFWQSLQGIKPGEVPVLNKYEKDNLQKVFSDWVDYEKGSREGFPDVEEQEIKVPMSKAQLAIYDTVMNQAPPWVASKIKSNLPPNKQESQQLNAYLQAARQVANTTAPFIQKGKPESPKVQKAFEELKKVIDTNPEAKAVIYSNYIKAGLDPYKELLTQNNIPFGEFSGNIPQKQRDQMIKDYNEGKLKALLLSSAGQQGLDLKNTNLVQLMESGWNEPSLEQAKARAIRYMSHSSLPKEQQKVIVQKFLSTRPETISQRLGLSDKEFAVDEYLQNLSRNKANLIYQFEELMKPKEVQEKTSSLKLVSLSNSLKEVLKASKRSSFKEQNFNPNKIKFKKIAKVEDKVLKFQESKDYSFLFKNINSPKFRSLLKKQSEDPAFINFVNNMGKHYSTARKGESFEVPSEKNPNKLYKVRKHSDKSYTCGCPDYQFNKSTTNGECKHIAKIKTQ